MRSFYCNPLNIPYRYQYVKRYREDTHTADTIRFREAADPDMLFYKGLYWLFPSMTAGFYTSADLLSWELHPYLQTMPVIGYAPNICIVDGKFCLSMSCDDPTCMIYRSADPRTEPFEAIPFGFSFWDPAMFQDDDGRVYLYYGCSNSKPLYGMELDPATLQPKTDALPLIYADIENIGYERRGERNVNTDGDPRPWNEGAYMTKYNGTYYLQYATPGTEFNVYSDAVYTSNAPLGPFTLAKNNPYSHKPGGFITAAGHGSTSFSEAFGFRHISTMRISLNHMFERRIGIWPAGFDEDGEMFCDQRYGDWPMRADAEPWTDPEWMLLSYRKPVRASGGAHPERIANEDIRDWWECVDKGAWVELDLEEIRDVRGIQINFADSDLLSEPNFDPERIIDTSRHFTRWKLEGSLDGKNYFVIADKTNADTDLPHDFLVFEDGFACRYLRLSAFELPFGQIPKVSGLRVFGHAEGDLPVIKHAEATIAGPLDMDITWDISDADGVCILWGYAADKLYHSQLVFGENKIRIGTLIAGEPVFVRVDAFNACGITRGECLKL